MKNAALAKVASAVGIPLLVLSAVACGAAPADGESVATSTEDLKMSSSGGSGSGSGSGSGGATCYSGSYKGDTLQTLSTEGTIPGSVGACASALLAHGCHQPGNTSSTLAVPWYMASAGNAYLVTECPAGTMSAINADNWWAQGSYPTYWGTVWAEINGVWQNAWFNGMQYSNGALYQIVNGQNVFYEYTGSSTWTGWAYNNACNERPSLNSTFDEDLPCVTRGSASDELTAFDPTCGSKCGD